MLTKLKKTLLLLLAVGGVLLTIIAAPFLIAGAFLLIWGGIALVVLSFITYAVWEWLRER